MKVRFAFLGTGLMLTSMAMAQAAPQGTPTGGDSNDVTPPPPQARRRMPMMEQHEKMMERHMDGEERHPFPMGKWWKNSELAKEIDLTYAQADQMEKIFQDTRLKLIDLHANLAKAEAMLEPLMESDSPDEA